MAALILIVVNF